MNDEKLPIILRFVKNIIKNKQKFFFTRVRFFEGKTMNVNFTGVHNPKIMIKRSQVLPGAADAIVVKCQVNDDENGNDFSELKRVVANAEELKGKFINFTEDDILDIRALVTEEGVGLSLNYNPVNLGEYSIFGICTVLCAITKKVLPQLENTPQALKYATSLHHFIDGIGRYCLKHLHK